MTDKQPVIDNDEYIETVKSMLFGEQAFKRFNAKERNTLNYCLNKLEAEPCEDCVSREAMLDYIRDNYRRWFINDDAFMQCVNGIKDFISVTPKQRWIPIKTRPMTDEEATYYRDWAEYEAEIFDCPLPEDGQEVLVSWGNNVSVDIFIRDNEGCYFENYDISEVDAWMPLPEPMRMEKQ